MDGSKGSWESLRDDVYFELIHPPAQLVCYFSIPVPQTFETYLSQSVRSCCIGTETSTRVFWTHEECTARGWRSLPQEPDGVCGKSARGFCFLCSTSLMRQTPPTSSRTLLNRPPHPSTNNSWSLRRAYLVRLRNSLRSSRLEHAVYCRFTGIAGIAGIAASCVGIACVYCAELERHCCVEQFR